MSKRKPLEIKIFPQGFYHINDEHFLFEWISLLTCVTSIDAYYLTIKSKRIKRDDLENLIGIFKRYEFENIEQLNIFRNKYNEDIFYYFKINDTREKKDSGTN
ncbi:MAG: hypothetical protein WC707_00505 [Candidatus Babeliaceae bacterium]|jgi:hypothetical protein